MDTESYLALVPCIRNQVLATATVKVESIDGVVSYWE